MTYTVSQEGRFSGPRYFFDFPNIKYAVSANSAGIPNYITIKDYFHLLRPRDDIFREDTIYQEYIVKNGERPDQIARDFYQDEQYYWIILQINEITDYWNQWPLSQLELDEFITRKYQTTEESLKIRHYVTPEVKDINGNILLESNLQVPANFQRPQMQMPARNAAANPANAFWGDFGEIMDNNPEDAWKYLAQAGPQALQTKLLVQDA